MGSSFLTPMFRRQESYQLSHSDQPVQYDPRPTEYSGRVSGSGGPVKSKQKTSLYNLIHGSEDDWDQAGFRRQKISESEPSSPPVQLGPGKTGKVGIDLVIEILLCASAVLAAIPFIWLAIAMARYHGKRVTEHDSEYIKQATATVSTLFTILFAAVVGTTLKRYATWHLGRGVKIGFLEQIMQSRTFFSAATTQIAMGAFNFTAVVLLCTWAFSPLGSQACLRLITMRTALTESASLISYVDMVTNQVFDSDSGVSSMLTSLKPTYVSTMISPPSTKNSSMDLWGNVKIPWLGNNLEPDEDGWVHRPASSLSESSYSALIGVPMADLTNVNSSFVIETTYIDLDCEQPRDEDPIVINTNLTKIENGTFFGPNTTSFDGNTGIYPFWEIAMDQFVSSMYGPTYPQRLENVTAEEVTPSTLLFQTRAAVSRCKIEQRYVESNVSCTGQDTVPIPGCRVQSQRTSPKKHAPAAVTTFSFPMIFGSAARHWILATDTLSSSGYSSLTEYYLQNTSAQFILAGNDRNYANYTNVTAEQFSTRLGQLLNTWLLAGLISADTMDFDLSHQNVTATYREGELVYVCSWAWLAVYCVSIMVMLAAALLTIWCAFHTTIPDVLSYCSSLTRDSKYFDSIAGGGSTMDGLQRAKALQNVKIRLGEVDRPSDLAAMDGLQGGFRNEVTSNQLGYLAIAPSNQARVARRGSLYD